jgi:hypothetical protein
MEHARIGSLALLPVLIGLSACQEKPGQPGPMERAGAQVDHVVAGMQRSVGEFSLRAGQGVDQARRPVGTAAEQVGTGLHDRLVPSVAGDAPRAPAAPGGTLKTAP